ncbi:unnamed protein product [Phytomonas sp. Hart1]|nr:unnamed protein product [Phytomonas sp. Hart1]|eukprot:CCW70161.1 unnamed protein product [Phytomonas sp. isolate Hart1]
MWGFNRLRVISSGNGMTAAALPCGFLTKRMSFSNLPREKLDDNVGKRERNKNKNDKEKTAAAALETFRSTAPLRQNAPPSLRERSLLRTKDKPIGKEEDKGEKRMLTFTKRNIKKKVKGNRHLRHTPPSLLVNDVRYFTGPHARRWIELFHYQHRVSMKKENENEIGWRFLAPSYRCPFCFSKKGITRGENAQSSYKKGEEDSSSFWMSPEALTNHLSWLHPHEGCSPQEFSSFNEHVVKCIVERQKVNCYRNDDNNNGKNGKLENESTRVRDNNSQADDERTRVGVSAEGSAPNQLSSSLYSSSLPLSPFELILLVDVANLELNSSPVVLELLKSREAMSFFSAIPVAFCMIHEIFIPHTAKTPHGFFRLAQLHPSSDLFTYYAVSRLESGDMGISSLIAELKLGLDACSRRKVNKKGKTKTYEKWKDSLASPLLPPMMILTMDKHLKTSLTMYYGDDGAYEGLFSMFPDMSECELMNSAIPKLSRRSEVKLYVPRAISIFQILRILSLLKRKREVDT